MAMIDKIYIDYQGRKLLDHDGTRLFVSEEEGYQFFGFDGKGFLHDGSPIQLPDGLTQYFDQDGRAIWPIDEKNLVTLINKQRDVFFSAMIARVNKESPLLLSEVEDLRLALLAAEHPNSPESRDLVWEQDIHKTNVKPICEETLDTLLHLEILWHSVWAQYQLRHKEILSARFVLNLQSNCPLAKLRSSESMLADELTYEFMRAERVIAPTYNLKELNQIGVTSHGVFLLDERLIKFVNKLGMGEGSKNLISLFKETYKNPVDIRLRIASWKNPLFMHQCIANVLWFNLVKERAQALYKKPPALPVIVNENIHAMMRKGVKYDKGSGKLLNHKGHELAQIDPNLIPMPSMDISAILKILRPENIKILNSVNAHRLLRWIVTTVTNQAVVDKIDARRIFLIGGYQEIAKIIGAGTGRKAASQVRDILLWLSAPQQFIFTNSETNKQEVIREANMLSFNYIPGGFNNKSSIEILVGTMLMPHYLYKLIHTSSLDLSNDALKLIPIVPEPQLIGRPADQGPQLSFQMETVVEFRKGAKEFAKNNCLRITRERFQYLAEKAGLSSRLCSKVVEAWLKGGDKAPPFLKEIEKDYYSFSDHYKRQQDFIIQGGQKELTMSQAAKKSVSSRQAGIFLNKPKKNSSSPLKKPLRPL